mgnify:CR=1 FL=1
MYWRHMPDRAAAIQLAAARIATLNPEIIANLGSALNLLTLGAHDIPERQQTLRRAIAWSYDLLNAEACALFRALAVFVGGCSFEAVHTILKTCIDHSPTITTDLLDELVRRNMLQVVVNATGTLSFRG